MTRVRRALHIYERSAGGFVTFYTLQDYLVFYTIVSVYARQYRIRVLGFAIMYNHFHLLVETEDRKDVRLFVSTCTRLFARLFNEDVGIEGHLFERPFGSALKWGDKNIRTAAGYLYNNHTNKKLCEKAEQTRWNFLAYAHDRSPFSEKIILSNASKSLRIAIREVDAVYSNGRYLNYATLRRLYKPLGKEEKEQLTDYIISVYNAIDFAALESLYRSYEDMLYSFNANTFNEYDISEDADERTGDDRVYNRLAKQVLESGKFTSVKDILQLSDDERFRLALVLQARTGASYKQIGAFVHLKITKVKNVFTGVDVPPPGE